METKTYRRKSFSVEAVEITDQNIDEVGDIIGRVMVKDDGASKFIQIDPVVIPNIPRAYPGFWLTIMNGRYRCYSAKAFKNQFELDQPEISIQMEQPRPVVQVVPVPMEPGLFD